MASIKLKPKAKKGVISIKCLIKHPMETGLRKKKGKIVPANYIENIVILHNGNKIVDADIGISISKNPYFKFKVPGKKGDIIELKYNSNKGETGSATVKSK
ncbi:thiosulfate oxidation carrier complex protein SoxZ [Candidatus Vesicomyidisocius calyptogenae]|uniref:Sulfur oxidation protein SoxZ n=1 Tax=Vesicomyosocius okutanii subsp. Calyptogena okutanii (strain HA) TaxID=412965 RepID=A5CW20_VESOH|nr:thiosulfate oxidation carrier complex protein SoxZ [Candidatus Vesicomyosocius okutanii]BAF61843.1 sulfur oxidation protein SoxZ [Candidatus Vesicomyosocius okutanii]